MQPTFRAQLETCGPTETREAWHGQWALCGTVIAPYGRQSTLQAGHREARHFAEQMQRVLQLKPIFELPCNSSLSRLQGELIRTPLSTAPKGGPAGTEHSESALHAENLPCRRESYQNLCISVAFCDGLQEQ